MDRHEAYTILTTALERYQSLGFTDLKSKIGTRSSEEVIGPSGVRYTLEMSFAWADVGRRAVTVSGRIDDQNTFRSVPLEERIRVSDSN